MSRVIPPELNRPRCLERYRTLKEFGLCTRCKSELGDRAGKDECQACADKRAARPRRAS